MAISFPNVDLVPVEAGSASSSEEGGSTWVLSLRSSSRAACSLVLEIASAVAERGRWRRPPFLLLLLLLLLLFPVVVRAAPPAFAFAFAFPPAAAAPCCWIGTPVDFRKWVSYMHRNLNLRVTLKRPRPKKKHKEG